MSKTSVDNLMMTIILAGTAIIGVAVTAIVASSKPKSTKTLDEVISDFNVIKSALLAYRKVSVGTCEKIDDLLPHIEGKILDVDRYSLSSDEKYLIFNAHGMAFEATALANRIGGSSYCVGNKAFLSFLTMSKISRVTPIAKIRTIPADEIFTTSLIDYDASESIVEDNAIAEIKWENNKRRFPRPGAQNIKLKVKDKNGTWSEWGVKTINVLEKEGYLRLFAGHDTLILLHQNGLYSAIGQNEFGQLGNGTVVPQQILKKNTAIDFVQQVACGEYHTLFKSYDGIVYGVGRNNLGQLGVGNRYDLKVPKEIWGLENIKQIDAGVDFSAALTYDGRVFVWGDNEHGQLGTDKFTSREMPYQIEELENIKQIACGNHHMTALLYDGTVIAWGSNAYGQLGVGYKGKGLLPIQAEFKGVQKIIAGRNTTYGITESGRVLVCGQNNKYQLGIQGEREILFPEEMLLLRGIVELKTKGNFVIAMDGVGEVYTWGQYSTLDENPFETPTKLKGLKYVKDIAATTSNGYALTNEDKVVRWSSQLNRLDALEMDQPGE